MVADSVFSNHGLIVPRTIREGGESKKSNLKRGNCHTKGRTNTYHYRSDVQLWAASAGGKHPYRIHNILNFLNSVALSSSSFRVRYFASSKWELGRCCFCASDLLCNMLEESMTIDTKNHSRSGSVCDDAREIERDDGGKKTTLPPGPFIRTMVLTTTMAYISSLKYRNASRYSKILFSVVYA